MLPYLLLLFFATALSFAACQSTDRTLRRFALVGIGIMLIVFAGVRNVSVGTDSGTYVNMFLRTYSIQDIWQSTEFGYNALQFLCISISDNYFVLFFSIAIITISSYIYVISSFSNNFYISIFSFISLGTYTFFFNGARQGIASALCFLSLPWLLDRSPIKYFITIGVACLFHNSALIFLPIYFVALPIFDWRILAAMGVVGIGAMASLHSIVDLSANLLSDRYSGYADAVEGGGKVTSAFIVFQGIALALMGKLVNVNKNNYNRLINIYFVGIIPVTLSFFASVNPSGILRLSYYFSQSSILIWEISLNSIKNRYVSASALLIFIIFGVIFFSISTGTFSNLTPYLINGGIFS